MRIALVSLIAALFTASLFAIPSDYAQAQAFPNDNDGLLDVGEAPGFPDDPGAAEGTLRLNDLGIEDLDGTNLLTNLRHLHLENNSITSIEKGDFEGLNSLLQLYLRNNAIASIEQGDFEGLNNLHYLLLEENAITSIESGDFEGLNHLWGLFLRDNAIAGIEPGDFDGLNRLIYLDLGGNGIASIEKEVFDGLTRLRELNLSGNAIFRIDSGTFNGFTKLQNLDLRSNPLSGLNLTAATFEALRMGYPLTGDGFLLDSDHISSLVLDEASLSRSSFDAIVRQTTSIVDVSLVGLTLTGGRRLSSLQLLLDIPTLDNVRVDPMLYEMYAAEFDAFAALPGNRVIVVPEPSSVVLLVLACVFWRRQRSWPR